MKKSILYFSFSIVLGLFLVSCGKTDEITPNKDAVVISPKTQALINALKGSWNTDLVKENGVLVYAKSDKKQSIADYSKFKLELYGDFNFKMTDKENNEIDGIWYVTKDNKLYLDYLKRDFSVPALTALCEHSCAGVVTVTIAFDLKEETNQEKISMENNNTEYLMKHDNL